MFQCFWICLYTQFNHNVIKLFFRVEDIGIISNIAIPLRIVNDGTVVWNPSGIYQVSCESDITYYPLDTQECTIKVSSWAYTAGEVELEFGGEPVDLKFYSPNGEWDLIDVLGMLSEIMVKYTA
jgi:hypothetical protein